MELSKAIELVKSGEFINCPIYEVWEIKSVLTMTNTPEATAALKAFDAKLSPEKLNEISKGKADDVEAVWNTIDDIKKDNNPLKDDEFQSRYNNFWNNIEFEQDTKEAVDKDTYRRQIEELAELEAEKALIETELANPGSFLNAPKEKQSEVYRNIIKVVLDTKCTELVAAQTVADLIRRGEKSDESTKTKVAALFNELTSGKNKKMKISSSNALNALAGSFDSVKDFAKNLEIFAGVKKGVKRVKEFDEKVTKAYPTAWPMAKGFVKTGAIGVLFGGAGIAAYGAWRLGKTIKTQSDTAAKKQMGYWEYLKSDKTQMFALGGAVVTTAISCAGLSAESFGLTGEAINGNLGEKVASMFSGADNAADSAVTLADRGKAFWNAIANNFSNTTYLARTGASVATSVAIASSEFAKLGDMEPGSKEYLAQKKAAWRMLRGSAYGTLLGMTVGGVMGAVNADHVVDNTTPETTPPTNGENVDTPVSHEVPEFVWADFPSEYSEDMGITESQYNNLTKLYSEEDLNRMYTNLSNNGVMDNFEGMTREEVIFKWSKLDAYTDRVRWDADAQQYVSIQGATRYHFEEEMTDLNRLLNCGQTLTAEEFAAINKGLACIDDKGGYHGPGYAPTNNYHVQGAGVEDCHEGQENHFNRGDKPEPQPETQVEPQVELQPEPQSEPVVVRQEEPVLFDNIPFTIKEMPINWAKEPDALVEYPSAYTGKDQYPNALSEGYGVYAIDKDGNGLTGRIVHAPDGRVGIALTNGDRVELEVNDANGISTQKSRYFNIIGGYEPADQETVANAATSLGGKPEELIGTTDKDGNTVYHYISKEGVHVTYKDGNSEMSVSTLDGKGAPMQIQDRAVQEMAAALNKNQEANINIESTEKAPQSNLTEVTTGRKNNTQNIYARFTNRGR